MEEDPNQGPSFLVTDGSVTSWSSSLLKEAMETSDVVANYSYVTEKPFSEYADVKAAVLIDRIYIPMLVSVGLVFNFLCFVTFVFTTLRTTSTCVYMAAIAVLDSVILGIALSVVVCRYLGHTVFYMRSDWTCGFHYFLFYFAIHSDVLVLLAMTVDRFIVVKLPLKAQSLCTPRSALKVVTGLGFFSFALNLQIFFIRRLVPSGNSGDPLICWYPAGDIEYYVEKVYTVIGSCIYSFIPFVSLLTLNLLIIKQLKISHEFSKLFTENRDGTRSGRVNTLQQRTKELKGSASTASNHLNTKRDEVSGPMKKSMAGSNINIMFLLVSFTFLLLTSPLVIVHLYARHVWQPQTNADSAWFRLILAFLESIMFSNHAINFLLYCVSGRRFRQELKKLLMRFCRRT